MAQVRLIAHSVLVNNEDCPKDPRRLIMMAVKTSQGKLRDNFSYYACEYEEERIGKWVRLSAKFPSVQEHIVFTFLIEGISRVTSHQLVRHRLASYTQESQRYSNARLSYVVPPSVGRAGSEAIKTYIRAINEAYRAYKELIEAGVPPEDARYILPQALTTTIIMTVNLRELIHIAKLRLSPEAQWEIREVVKQMIEEASKVVPEIKELIEV